MPAAIVARSINERGKYKAGNPDRPDKRALLPAANPNTGRIELSTFSIDGLEDNDIWALLRRQGNVYGRADLTREVIEQAGLSLDENNVPPRHVDIIGWNPDDFAERMKIASNLAKVLPAFRAPDL
jgi:hypothetical protein